MSASPSEEALRVGVVPGVTLTRWTRAWAERFPEIVLVVTPVSERDQRALLDDGRLDLCFVRTPLGVELPGVQLVSLYEEQAVVVVPRDHPVSLYDAVTLADLSEETLLDQALLEQEGTADPYDLVAGGAGLLVVPQAVARAQSRRDLVARPVSDAVPTRVALAWRRDREHPATQDFVGVVRGRTVNSSRGPAVTEVAEPAAKSSDPGRTAAKKAPTPKNATRKNSAGRRPARRGGPRR